MKYYKFLNSEGRSSFQGRKWNLPTKNEDGTWTPGKWMPRIKAELVMCKNGYHLTDARYLLDWREAQLFEAEYEGDILEGDTKVAVRRCRLIRKVEDWNDKNLRLFAVWCAREALKLIDNPDARSITACDVAEKYANGEANDSDLNAAWAAARDAAWAATRAAAWDATRAATKAAAWDAAWDAQYRKLWEMIGLEERNENGTTKY